MKYTFAAIRFSEDKNIAENVYWYLCDFPVKEGEYVLAPVGAHNGLQCACIERVKQEDENNAPYDMKLIKYVAAKLGARRFPLESAKNCRDLGGVRWDEKRFTRFGAFLRSDYPASFSEKDAETLSSYGVTTIIDLREKSEKRAGEWAQNYFSVENCPVAADGFDDTKYAQSAGIRKAFKLCARADGCVLFGCGTGKDRTGVLAALLLLSAGVSAENVLEDFLLSARFVGETQKEAREKAFSEFLQTVIKAGVNEYLRDLGVTDCEIDCIKQKLTGYHSTGR